MQLIKLNDRLNFLFHKMLDITSKTEQMVQMFFNRIQEANSIGQLKDRKMADFVIPINESIFDKELRE